MTRSRYPINESIIRLLRALEGKPIPSDTPSVIPGEYLNENEAWSDIAELFEGSLPGETLTLPAAGIPFATVAEANAGVSNVVALSPASHTWAHEYGGIYCVSGTADQAFPQSTYTKITGAFQYYTDNSGGEIDCDWDDDRIIVNETGSYLILWQASVWTWSGATPLIRMEAYNNVAGVPGSRASVTLGASGTVSSMSGIGCVTVVSGTLVDLRASLSAASTIHVESAQLFVQKMVG